MTVALHVFLNFLRKILVWKNVMGTYKVRNEIETKRNETKSTKTKRNQRKQNEINENKTK